MPQDESQQKFQNVLNAKIPEKKYREANLAPFAQQLRQFAKDFNTRAIEAFIQQFLE